MTRNLTLWHRIAKALYDSDRDIAIADAKEANRNLRRDSLLRADERVPTWNQVCKQSGFVGEHPQDRYLRLAAVALEEISKR